MFCDVSHNVVESQTKSKSMGKLLNCFGFAGKYYCFPQFPDEVELTVKYVHNRDRQSLVGYSYIQTISVKINKMLGLLKETCPFFYRRKSRL